MVARACLLIALLAAPPALAATAERVKIAAPGLNFIDFDAAKGTFLVEHIAASMVSERLQVVTQREINSLLGLERQKQLLGCHEESSSCLAELASALGVDGVLLGDVVHLGKRYQFTLKVVSSRDGTALSLRTGKAASEEDLVDALAVAARELATEVVLKLRGLPLAAAPTEVGQRGGARRAAKVPALAGGIVAGAGVALVLTARVFGSRLDAATVDNPLPAAEAVRNRDLANGLQAAGVVSLGVGVAALLSAGGLYLFGGDAPVQPTVFLAPGAAGVAVTGALP